MFTIKAAEQGCKAEKGELASEIHSLLLVGKFLGFFPISVGRTKWRKLKPRRHNNYAPIGSYVGALLMALNTGIGAGIFLKSSNRSAIAMAAIGAYFVIHLISTCIYIFWIRNFRTFTNICELFKGKFPVSDPRLRVHTCILVAGMFVSVTTFLLFWNVRAGLSAWEASGMGSGSGNSSLAIFYEHFYRRGSTDASALVPYHPITATCFLYTYALSACVNEYADVLIIVLCRALYYRIKGLTHQANLSLTAESAEGANKYVNFKGTQLIVKDFMADFKPLMELISLIREFLSPLFFLSMCMNVFLISLTLCLTMYSGYVATQLDSIHANFSFLHKLIRSYLVLFSAAKVHEQLYGRVRDFLERIPDEHFTAEVKRVEYKLNHCQLGLTGLGYFTLNKRFMMKFIGVIFTMVIFLYQSTVQSSK